jgi:hypothetical protein
VVPIIFDISIFRGDKFCALKMDATFLSVYALHGITSQKTKLLLLLQLLVLLLLTAGAQPGFSLGDDPEAIYNCFILKIML